MKLSSAIQHKAYILSSGKELIGYSENIVGRRKREKVGNKYF